MHHVCTSYVGIVTALKKRTAAILTQVQGNEMIIEESVEEKESGDDVEMEETETDFEDWKLM